jgi:hypothetical protein
MIARLIEDSYPFLKGTEFIITGGDDGMWSRYAFYSGEVDIQGDTTHISVERDKCEIITRKQYKGKVLVEEDWLNPKPMTDSEFWEDWINSPG